MLQTILLRAKVRKGNNSINTGDRVMVKRKNYLLNENQAGFGKHYSTTDHIFSLFSLLELLNYEKKKLFFCCVDFSKAFDSVWRIGLWRKLINTHVNRNYLRDLQNIYKDIKSCISLEGGDSLFSSAIVG